MATSSIRVLLVDDFDPFRRLLRSILQNEFELGAIVEASDGGEAIALAQALQPDLILLDIGLPKLDGIEAARRIRELAPAIEDLVCQPRIVCGYRPNDLQCGRIGLRC